jgi:S-adenosylmethionine synthetase
MAVELLEANEDYYEVSVEIAYAIGVAEPVALQATGKTVNGVEFNIDLPDGHDLTPSGIIKDLNLRTPIFEETAQRGHFGNTFGWR